MFFLHILFSLWNMECLLQKSVLKKTTLIFNQYANSFRFQLPRYIIDMPHLPLQHLLSQFFLLEKEHTFQNRCVKFFILQKKDPIFNNFQSLIQTPDLSLSPMEAKLLVFVSTLVLLATGATTAYTFSSKLIHRFSEEAKVAFKVSRDNNEEISGGSSWPRRRSMEYYNLLVGNDLQRQEMKLGGQYKYLFPSQGSKTMSFGNDFGWLHYSWIDIGTPNVSFLVALDTGSDLLWLPCDCIQCAPLSSTYYSSLDRDLTEYNPSASSTSKHLSCSHELCDLGPNCKNPAQPCPYIVKYYSENTSTSGFLVEDTLHLSTNNDHASRSTAHAPVFIGCGRKQSGGYLDGVAPDGLMGLGLGDISVPSVLAKAGLMRNSFSMCFNEDDSGRIFFGDQGPSKQESTPFLPLDGKYIAYMVEVKDCCIGTSCIKQSGFQAQVDSGTSFTLLPDEAYKKVSLEFDRRVNAKRSSYEGSPWEYCYEASSEELRKIPSVTLMFALNNTFVVRNPIFLIYGDQGVTGFCLAIQSIEGDSGIIGQNFMTGYRIVYDRENLKLHWSRSNCQDLSESKGKALSPGPENPLPTNEQQRTPHGQAVTPAVAGRTPPNPSAASPHFLTQFCMMRMLLLPFCPFILLI